MTNFVLVRPVNPYGVVVYDNVIRADQCTRLRDYFDAAPKTQQSTTINGKINGKPRTFEEILLDENVGAANELLGNVLRRVRGSLDKYFDEYIAEPNFRQQVKEGCYSLQPRMKKYNVGDDFPIHTDDASLLSMTRKFAYIMYLNDDFEGGSTIFRSGISEVTRVQPKAGSLLVFPIHPIYMHEGERIERGSKYVLNGFATILTSQLQVQSPDGRPLGSKREAVDLEIRAFANELMRVAGILFSER